VIGRKAAVGDVRREWFGMFANEGAWGALQTASQIRKKQCDKSL